jgi:hypothetical protein
MADIEEAGIPEDDLLKASISLGGCKELKDP